MNGISGVGDLTIVAMAMSGVWPVVNGAISVTLCVQPAMILVVAYMSPDKLKIELPSPVEVEMAAILWGWQASEVLVCLIQSCMVRDLVSMTKGPVLSAATAAFNVSTILSCNHNAVCRANLDSWFLKKTAATIWTTHNDRDRLTVMIQFSACS